MDYQSNLEKAEQEPLLSTRCEERPASAYSHPRRCEKRNRRRKGLRFFFAFLVSYFLFRLFISDVVRLVRDRRGHGMHPEDSWTAAYAGEDSDQLPDHMDITECADWSEPEPSHHERHFKFQSNASLELPLSSEKLFLLSRGPLSTGILHVVQSDEPGETVKVTTTFGFNRKKQLKLARFCLVEALEGQNGLGVFTHLPEHRRRRHNFKMGFHVKVELPHSAEGLLNIKDFETDMPFFAHKIEDLSAGVHFDSVSLQSKFTPIHVEGLSAASASAESGFSPIEGNFVVNKSLVISTSHSPIKVNATLNNANDENGEATTLILETSNAPIKANVILVSTVDSAEGGNFKVDAQSSTSPVAVSFSSAPVNSKLTLDVHSSFSPATVHLHPTYEGKFSLTTSFGATQVKFDENEEDPAKKGRTRQVLLDNVGRNTVRGAVEWEDGGKDRGHVEISSSMSPVVLYL